MSVKNPRTHTTTSTGNQPLLAWLILAGLVLTWGSSFILIKRALVYYSAIEVGALRVVITFLFLLPFALPRLKKLAKKDLIWLALAGTVGSFFPAFLFAAAQKGIDSSTAGLLNSLTPLFTLIIGLIIFSIKVKKIQIIGVLVGLLGAFGLVSSSGGHDFSFNIPYALMVVLATIFYAVNVNLIKAKLGHIKSITITAMTFFIVGLPAAIILFGTTDFVHKIQHEPEAWTGLGYLAILAIVGTGIAMMGFNMLIKITTPIFASSVTYLIPVVALLWGIIDGEYFHPGFLIWIGLIIGGVLLVNRNKVNPSKISRKRPV
ncbi:MAG: DMT family transporter [Bacteroidales bacterium]|jgi:drug/metabolite transporter (DMT)-like permease|nr:DMT family transporter [Bacteroidales bacterium]